MIKNNKKSLVDFARWIKSNWWVTVELFPFPAGLLIVTIFQADTEHQSVFNVVFAWLCASSKIQTCGMVTCITVIRHRVFFCQISGTFSAAIRTWMLAFRGTAKYIISQTLDDVTSVERFVRSFHVWWPWPNHWGNFSSFPPAPPPPPFYFYFPLSPLCFHSLLFTLDYFEWSYHSCFSLGDICLDSLSKWCTCLVFACWVH